jgi:hypothetical protein
MVHKRLAGPARTLFKETLSKGDTVRGSTARERTELSDKPNPIQIQKFLAGVDYPADRSTLVSTAEEEGAEGAVLDALKAIPDKEYDSPTAVSSAVSDSNDT